MKTMIIAGTKGLRRLTAVEIATEKHNEECHVRLAKLTNGKDPDAKSKRSKS